MSGYSYVTLRERPEIITDAALWFSDKWGVPVEAYLDCMEAYLEGRTELGWYLCLEGERIVGGLGVIENDFHDRKDLTPNVCAVYVEEDCRRQGIAGRLLDLAAKEMRRRGIWPLYLVTDHVGFYERYGWEFLCMVQGDGEPEMTRMYRLGGAGPEAEGALSYGDPDADTVLIQPVDEHDLTGMENEVKWIREHSSKPFRLLAVPVENWNADLSPWEAPAVFGNEAFSGGAARTLEKVKRLCEDGSKTYVIGGYSLAGLFALWAVYQTDRFQGAAAASASLWFPEFTDFMEEDAPRCRAVYLSLGDREEKAKNPVMASVGDRTREAYACLREQGVTCTLEWNEGNHFRDADVRTAKAFAWVLDRV